tara:strand:+ start:552 stop:665 length:114 start_codon:yes stop_codon:yes gene_type:complete
MNCVIPHPYSFKKFQGQEIAQDGFTNYQKKPATTTPI